MWVSNNKSPLDDAKSLTAYIIQTIENHMLYPLDHGKPGDQKRNLNRIKKDLHKLDDILRDVE